MISRRKRDPLAFIVVFGLVGYSLWILWLFTQRPACRCEARHLASQSREPAERSHRTSKRPPRESWAADRERTAEIMRLMHPRNGGAQ